LKLNPNNYIVTDGECRPPIRYVLLVYKNL
jgi:hypothetical protein